jgi:AcrR family transcriptional regulator
MHDTGLLAKAVERIGSPAAEGTAERILDAALKQFELVGVQRSTVEDITRRAGLSRVTLYRHFKSKNDITEAVLLRELATFLADLEAKARNYSELEDKLVEGFVFAQNSIREHRLLNRLMATEPETVLPFLTTDGSSMVSAASAFLAHQLSVTLPGDPRTHAELLEVAEVTVRIILSLLLTPSQYIPLADDDSARDFARRYLVPPLLGLSSDRRKGKSQ